MMAGKGGYQRPTNPAPVSGPGSMSQRTDGGPGAKQPARYISGMPYGEGQETYDIQTAAPMEAAPDSTMMGREQRVVQGVERPVTDLFADSEFPTEPVTEGVDMGPGRGSTALPSNLGPRDTEEVVGNPLAIRYLPDLMAASRLPGAPDSYRRFVNYLSQQV